MSKYKVLGELGKGAMGAVYRAFDSTLEREVALKIIDSRALSSDELAVRFRREMRILTALSHPNIVKLYDEGTIDGQFYFAMELVPGRDLQSILETHVPVGRDRLASMLEQLLDALDCAHSAGVIHRDIKPKNLMVEESGRVVLLDFGLARMAGATVITEAGFRLGTMAYFAPELVKGADASPATDLWSLGIVAYELATGQHAFCLDSAARLLNQICNLEFARLETVRPDLGRGLSGLIHRLLERKPADRWPSAREAREALARLGDSAKHGTRAVPAPSSPGTPAGQTVPLPVPPPEARPVPRPERRPASRPGGTGRGRLPAAALAVAAILVAGLTLSRAPGPTTGPTARTSSSQASAASGRGASAVDLRARWVPGPDPDLVITFRTAGPVRSRLRARTRERCEWSAWEAIPARDHRFVLKGADMPISSHWEIEHQNAEGEPGEHPERPQLPDETRLAYLEGVVDWFVAQASAARDKALGDTLGLERRRESDMIDPTRLLDAFTGIIAQRARALPPTWFADEVGGPGGILDHPGIVPARKVAFALTIAEMESLAALTSWLRIRNDHPVERYYGTHFGPSRTPHYPGAVAMPISLAAQVQRDGRRPAGERAEERPLFLTLQGAEAEFFPELINQSRCLDASATVILPRLAKTARVELRFTGRMPRGRSLDVTVNQHQLRVFRLDRTGRDRRDLADVYFAFDPACLKEGTNTIEFRCSPMWPFLESLRQFEPYVAVVPASFSLCIR